MNKPLALLSLAAALAGCASGTAATTGAAPEVRLVNDAHKRQVDVLVDG
ncbi:MAG: lipoprotein, partial [Verrucomicrobiota bacterium]